MNDVEAFYTQYAADVYRFALYLTGNVSEAEDITSEVFTRILLSTQPIYTESIKSYLLTIARNLNLQAKRRKPSVAWIESDDMATDSLEHQHQMVVELRTTFENLQRITESDRAALLFRSEGMSYRDIALHMAISEVSAKVKVHRARKQLKEYLNEN